MIAPAKPVRRSPAPAWHKRLVEMLPAIRRHARIAFRHLRSEAREEAIEAVVCNACCALARLAELDKLDIAYASPLARYGVAQVRDGRKVGCKLNIRDVLSPYCQQRKRITVERLDKFDEEEGRWIEAVVEDHRTPPPDQAAFRCDFPAWLSSLTRRNRRIAEALALSHTTGHVAKRFKLSEGRISQIRTELKQGWQRFVGDEPVPTAT
jgi:hypothetical protein